MWICKNERENKLVHVSYFYELNNFQNYLFKLVISFSIIKKINNIYFLNKFYFNFLLIISNRIFLTNKKKITILFLF